MITLKCSDITKDSCYRFYAVCFGNLNITQMMVGKKWMKSQGTFRWADESCTDIGEKSKQQYTRFMRRRATMQLQ